MAQKDYRNAIAMLHHVSDEASWSPLNPFVISRQRFLDFLDTIEASGREGKSMAKHKKVPHPNDVIITFDDCGKHLLDFAVPELCRRNMSATFYFPTYHEGGFNDWDVAEGKPKVELMNAEDLRAIIGMGMELGGHSHRHVRLADLTRKEVLENLTTSKKLLEDWTGTAVNSMAWPYGSIPEFPDQLLEESGFESGCAIFAPSPSRSTLRRFIVHEKDSRLSLRLKFGKAYRAYRSWTDPRKS